MTEEHILSDFKAFQISDFSEIWRVSVSRGLEVREDGGGARLAWLERGKEEEEEEEYFGVKEEEEVKKVKEQKEVK